MALIVMRGWQDVFLSKTVTVDCDCAAISFLVKPDIRRRLYSMFSTKGSSEVLHADASSVKKKHVWADSVVRRLTS